MGHLPLLLDLLASGRRGSGATGLSREREFVVIFVRRQPGEQRIYAVKQRRRMFIRSSFFLAAARGRRHQHVGTGRGQVQTPVFAVRHR